jgi:hypothetical protein
VKSQGSSTMMGSELSLEASLLLERATLEEMFSLRAKQVREQAIDPSSAYRHAPFSGEHHLQKVVLAVCAYFTMGAELE